MEPPDFLRGSTRFSGGLPIRGHEYFGSVAAKAKAGSATPSADYAHVEICVVWTDCRRQGIESCSGISNDIGTYVWVGIASKVNSDRRVGNGVALDWRSRCLQADTRRATEYLVGGHRDVIRLDLNSDGRALHEATMILETARQKVAETSS